MELLIPAAAAGQDLDRDLEQAETEGLERPMPPRRKVVVVVECRALELPE